jgi:hypothetical protein
MAKNSFFIRASVNVEDDESFRQTEIDLGSYTNLGSSKPEVLRIHNISFSMTDSAGQFPSMTGDKGGSACWQLTTQTQSALVLPTDDSYVSGGRAACRNPDSETIPPTQTVDEMLLPQDFTGGYVVAVPSLFLGGLASNNFAEDVYYSLVIECTTEPMSKANAVALAISQQ